ncbi:uncharacterized protein PAC_17481 [Phialocephala subalpina]|uniref:Uncharacterized protein n=1 Tax=Phialocephala subalpina TaxID=576137 RepID=A0A1L7XR96_9HELO|nr:uncharacterized protein PAC_17481 [Phialocephala subalpina]
MQLAFKRLRRFFTGRNANERQCVSGFELLVELYKPPRIDSSQPRLSEAAYIPSNEGNYMSHNLAEEMGLDSKDGIAELCLRLQTPSSVQYDFQMCFKIVRDSWIARAQRTMSWTSSTQTRSNSRQSSFFSRTSQRQPTTDSCGIANTVAPSATGQAANSNFEEDPRRGFNTDKHAQRSYAESGLQNVDRRLSPVDEITPGAQHELDIQSGETGKDHIHEYDTLHRDLPTKRISYQRTGAWTDRGGIVEEPEPLVVMSDTFENEAERLPGSPPEQQRTLHIMKNDVPRRGETSRESSEFHDGANVSLSSNTRITEIPPSSRFSDKSSSERRQEARSPSVQTAKAREDDVISSEDPDVAAGLVEVASSNLTRSKSPQVSGAAQSFQNYGNIISPVLEPLILSAGNAPEHITESYDISLSCGMDGSLQHDRGVPQPSNNPVESSVSSKTSRNSSQKKQKKYRPRRIKNIENTPAIRRARARATATSAEKPKPTSDDYWIYHETIKKLYHIDSDTGSTKWYSDSDSEDSSDEGDYSPESMTQVSPTYPQ